MSKGLDMTEQQASQLGWEAIGNHEWEQAEEHFRGVLEFNPFHADALAGMAALYLNAGDIEQARELCEVAAAQAERDLPRSKRHTGWDDAVLRPYLRSLYYLSLTYIRQDAWALAQPALEEIVAWDVSGMEGRALTLLAQVLHRIERWEEAVHAYLQAAEYFPEDYYTAGLLLFQLGKSREAERMWRRALDRRPDLATFIVHYPRLVPHPRGGGISLEFQQTIDYLQSQGAFWDEPSKAELSQLYGRRQASWG